MPTRELAWKKYSFLGFGEKLQNSHQRPSLWEKFESLHSPSLKSCCRSKASFFSSFEKKKGEIQIRNWNLGKQWPRNLVLKAMSLSRQMHLNRQNLNGACWSQTGHSGLYNPFQPSLPLLIPVFNHVKGGGHAARLPKVCVRWLTEEQTQPDLMRNYTLCCQMVPNLICVFQMCLVQII